MPAEAAAAGDGEPPADRRLLWCREAAIAELGREAPGVPRRPAPDWQSAIGQVSRERLDPRLRPTYDDLLIDALGGSGAWDDLHARLARIPPAECGPRVWAALETGAMFRLARAARESDPERRRARIGGLRDEVNRLAWPAGSPFPAQFAARVAAALKSRSGFPARLRRMRTWPVPRLKSPCLTAKRQPLLFDNSGPIGWILNT